MLPAFSDRPDGEVSFVQHRVWAERGQVGDLFRRNGVVYVCGDGRQMAPAVRETLVQIYQEASGAGGYPRPSDGLMLSSTNAVVTYRTFSPDHIVEGALTSTHRGGRGVRDTRDHDAMARRAGGPRRRARLRQDRQVHQSRPEPPNN